LSTFLGLIAGKQGNLFTGYYTSNDNLAEGAMNALRNRAKGLGANYVQLLTNQSGLMATGGAHGFAAYQSDVTNTGNAYACPPATSDSDSHGLIALICCVPRRRGFGVL